MENHPIPQDITGFQFKLIGNMTVKQFVYLAVGAFFTWLFLFILKLPTIVQWPLAILSFSCGAALAFVPVDGRPMDTMLGNFFRALVAPTKFIYQKNGDKTPVASIPMQTNASGQTQQSGFIAQTITTQEATETPPTSETTAPQILTNLTPPSSSPTTPSFQNVQVDFPPVALTPPPVIAPLQQPTQPIYHPAAPLPPTAPSTVTFPTPTITPASVGVGLSQPKPAIPEEPIINTQILEENKKLQEEVLNLKKALLEKQNQPAPPLIQAKTPEQELLEKQLAESLRQKQEIEKQFLELKAKMEGPKQAFNPGVATPAQTTQRVRKAPPPSMEKSVGTPSMPEDPNLITGIIKDPRGNPISNILVEVKDADSNPVRAFKTNTLGKFASATSLSNGKYLITFEDSTEKNKFDDVEIELIGAPVIPLEIISVDPREELRRELFK